MWLDRWVVSKLVMAIGVAAALSGGLAQGSNATELGIWQGVYSAEQAERGQVAYQGECAQCHGEGLRGIEFAPSLVGLTFNLQWRGKTVGDLYTRVRTTMPQHRPGALTNQQYIDIVSFILSSNGFPEGATELPVDEETLNQIEIVAKPSED